MHPLQTYSTCKCISRRHIFVIEDIKNRDSSINIGMFFSYIFWGGGGEKREREIKEGERSGERGERERERGE